MQGEAITIKKLRTLNEHERNVLKAALRAIAETHGLYRWAAQSMLEQNMVDNFMWGSD